MAVDLRIESFSIDLFRSLWYRTRIADSMPSRLKEYNESFDTCANSDAVISAVLSRQAFFQNTLCEILYTEYYFYSNSLIDFYLYIQNNMNKFIAYNDLNIFEKLFMTCAVVSVMSAMCSNENNTIYLCSAPLSWAMYFDTECKEEFYEKGGWTKLEHYAYCYRTELLYYNNLHSSRCKYKSDFLNARDRFESASNEYSMPVLLSIFKNKMTKEKNKTSCPECLHLFYTVNAISCASDDNITEFKFTECYLQMLKFMLSKEELLESEQEVLRDSKFEQISEIISIVRKHSKDSKSELFGDKSAFYQQFDAYMELYRAQNTCKLLSRLFISNLELKDEQCLFCGIKLNHSFESLESTNDYRMERIKSAICDTVINVVGKDVDSTKVPTANKRPKSNKKKDDIDDVLRLFFSLGIEQATSNMLANFKRKELEKTLVKITDSCDAMHIQKSLEDKIKENNKKKKPRKYKN